MSSIRTSPTSQPSGARMLKRISSVTVNAAWPAAKEIAAGARPASRIANGSSSHSTRRVGADEHDERAAEDEPGGRAEQRR